MSLTQRPVLCSPGAATFLPNRRMQRSLHRFCQLPHDGIGITFLSALKSIIGY
jgi:hypothetical protein